MNKSIGILGGDLRIIYLAKILAKEGYNVYTYGIENYKFFNSNIVKCKTVNKISEFCNNIISGIPLSKDGIFLNAPFADKKIDISSTLKELNNKTLIAGAIKEEIKEEASINKVDIMDLMEDEGLTIMNIIPTVEGAIQIAMENTEFTIHNSKCLVLGFGRIGKLLSKQLRCLGANVGCMARKEKDLAWIRACGYKEVHIDNLNKSLYEYDIIFNTIPSLILDNEKLEILKNKNTNVTIIDLASNPGGVDFVRAKEYNIKTIHSLGLPGKVAPITAAKYIKETLEKILN